MFAGHVGVGLALGGMERRANVGLFVAASLWLDALLWILVLMGWETVEIPPDFHATHQPHFVFPFSHSLPAAAVWSILAGGLVWIGSRNSRVASARLAIGTGVAVFSHWVLDVVVHRPEMSLTGGRSDLAGLGLWNHLSVALAVESTIVAIGLAMFLHRPPVPSRKGLLVTVTLLLMGFTAVGMTIAPAPPSPAAMAGTSLASVIAVCALYAWLGRPEAKPGPPPAHGTRTR